jgi:LysM repeat protein
VGGREWQRYAAPAGFLLAATVAIVLIHSGLQAGGNTAKAPASVPSTPRKRVATTTGHTTTAKSKPSTQRFWTVQAGDTFGVISSKAGVPVASLEQLNPTVKSTSLFIGEKIRLR